MNKLLDYFSRLGSRYNLNFSGLEVLKDGIIGFDGIKRKLLVLSGVKKGHLQEYVIDLSDVKTCSVKKYYGKINANGLRHKRLEQYLEKMVMHFDFHSKKQAVDILFYKPAHDTIHELPQLEQKAQKWKRLLSKLLKPHSLMTAKIS